MNRKSLSVILASIILIMCVTTTDVESAARRWSVTVCGPVSHPLRKAVAEAVDFWNGELAGLDVNLSLGPITDSDLQIPDTELARISESVMKGEQRIRASSVSGI